MHRPLGKQTPIHIYSSDLEQILDSYELYVSVRNNQRSGQYDLVMQNIQLSHAGTYYCVDSDEEQTTRRRPHRRQWYSFHVWSINKIIKFFIIHFWNIFNALGNARWLRSMYNLSDFFFLDIFHCIAIFEYIQTPLSLSLSLALSLSLSLCLSLLSRLLSLSEPTHLLAHPLTRCLHTCLTASLLHLTLLTCPLTKTCFLTQFSSSIHNCIM